MDQQQVDFAKRWFLGEFPEFRTFAEPGEEFRDAEDTYKRKAVLETRKLLGPLVNEGQVPPTDAACRKLVFDVVRLTNFLNWRDNDYIRKDLLEGEGDFVTFARLLGELLRVAAEDTWKERLAALLAWLQEKGCSANISKVFPTYFLFLWDPDRHICIKPSVFDSTLR